MTKEQLIWDLLMEDIKNPFGVAGLMGNLMAESSMKETKITGKINMTGAEYVAQIKNGAVTTETFAHDGIAYGLAQWRYWSRKESLLNFVGRTNIDDVALQIRFLLWEIKTYKEVWSTLLTAKSVREASDMVLLKYEKPANVGDSAKEKRATYGQKYYDQFAKPEPNHDPMPEKKYLRTTADKVNVRSGNDKGYATVGRINKSGTKYEWIATANNGWHAIKFSPTMVAWVSGEFSEVVNG